MSIFEPHIKEDLTKTQIEQMQQKRQEFTLIGQQRRIRGLSVFSYNIITGEIKAADVQYSKDVDFMTRKSSANPKLVIEPNCIYRQALNKKSFIKRLKREGIL